MTLTHAVQEQPDGGARLVALLDEQIGLCRRLDELGARQEECIEASDTDALLRVLAQRQSLVDRIGVLSVELEPLRSRREVVLAALPEAQRHRVRSLVGDLRELADRIQKRDEDGRRTLQQRQGVIAEEIAGLTRARSAVSAYGQAYGPGRSGGPRIQDSRG